MSKEKQENRMHLSLSSFSHLFQLAWFTPRQITFSKESTLP
jgi:hypothetical protein